MKNVVFYFDFVSPFAYICMQRLGAVPLPLTYKPVLFAGLLNHWGQKGPAEIPAKRLWTYRWCTWWASQLGIAFRFPAEHPFNPLHHLRLALACGSRPEAVKRIFESIWTSGANANDPQAFSALLSELGVDPSTLADERIKNELKKNTEEAAAQGVFGVPSFVADGEVFWGADSIEFLGAYLAEPALFNSQEMRRISSLPVGAARKA
jgi:2-hydroxychromene-2-carboxylate isomerase